MRDYQRLYALAERAELPDAVVYTLQDAVTVLTRPSSRRGTSTCRTGSPSTHRRASFGWKGRRTPQTLADQDQELLAQGRTRLTVFALDRSGTVVGFTCAVPTGGDEPHVDQWGTIVRAADRGHRLGLALKVAGVREIQRRFPAERFVSTVNAETNAPMVAVNEALGFTPYAIEDDLRRIL